MCNCNQQRTQYVSDSAPARMGTVRIKLVGEQPITLSGSYTGRMYVFRNSGDTNWVDKRDLPDFEGKVELVMI